MTRSNMGGATPPTATPPANSGQACHQLPQLDWLLIITQEGGGEELSGGVRNTCERMGHVRV